MSINISRQKLVDQLVDGVTIVRDSTTNRMKLVNYIKSKGSFNPSVGSTYYDVSDSDEDTNYTILVEVNWNTSVWITNKTTSGFRINFGSAPSGAVVRWVKIK